MEWTSFQGIYVNLLRKRWEKFSPNCYCVIQLFISLWTLWILPYTVEHTESNALWKSFRLVNIVSDNFLSLINVDIWEYFFLILCIHSRTVWSSERTVSKAWNLPHTYYAELIICVRSFCRSPSQRLKNHTMPTEFFRCLTHIQG